MTSDAFTHPWVPFGRFGSQTFSQSPWFSATRNTRGRSYSVGFEMVSFGSVAPASG